MLYRLALGTGLRANELRSLTPGSFLLDAEHPGVTVEAGYSKRRRRDVQPLTPGLTRQLKTWLAGRDGGARVFLMPEPCGVVRMFRADLKGAREAWVAEATTSEQREAREASDFLLYRDAENHVVDFHSL